MPTWHFYAHYTFVDWIIYIFSKQFSILSVELCSLKTWISIEQNHCIYLLCATIRTFWKIINLSVCACVLRWNSKRKKPNWAIWIFKLWFAAGPIIWFSFQWLMNTRHICALKTMSWRCINDIERYIESNILENR